MENSAKKLKNVIIKKNISISDLDTEITGIKGNSREIIRWIYGIPNNINTALPFTSVDFEERELGHSSYTDLPNKSKTPIKFLF